MQLQSTKGGVFDLYDDRIAKTKVEYKIDKRYTNKHSKNNHVMASIYMNGKAPRPTRIRTIYVQPVPRDIVPYQIVQAMSIAIMDI